MRSLDISRNKIDFTFKLSIFLHFVILIMRQNLILIILILILFFSISVCGQAIRSSQKTGRASRDAQLLPAADEYTNETLPVILEEPHAGYATKEWPAVLHCKAAHATTVAFTCNDEPMKTLNETESTDPATGITFKEVWIQVRKITHKKPKPTLGKNASNAKNSYSNGQTVKSK